jgi:uncharacterized protein
VNAEVFLDAGFAIALAAATDQLHPRALALAKQMQAAGTRLITTHAVLLEIGNALSKHRYRSAAVQLLTSLAADPKVTIVPVRLDLYQRAVELFRNRPDKEWGLIDCLSFLVMSDMKITEARTHDEHFVQAGFQALLRIPGG